MKPTATGDGSSPDEERHKPLLNQVACKTMTKTKTNPCSTRRNVIIHHQSFFTQPTLCNLFADSGCFHWRTSHSLHLHFFYKVSPFLPDSRIFPNQNWFSSLTSLPRLPLGDSSTILFSSPVLVITLSDLY